jgi:peptidoglycan/xylan/chitin deacetylase (PgdA/CDA1 family)
LSQKNSSLLLKKIFFRSGLYSIIRNIYPNRNAAILRYHAIVEEEKNFYTAPGIALSPFQFEKHVNYFSQNYSVVSLNEVVDKLIKGENITKNCVVFTFDDGYADNFLAAQILNKYSKAGTFYITTEAVGRESKFWVAEITFLILKTTKDQFKISLNDYKKEFLLSDQDSRWKAIRELIRFIKSNSKTLREKVRKQLSKQIADSSLMNKIENFMLTWDQVKEMREMGMTIGSHTLTHQNLPNADPEDASIEISESKQILSEILGEDVRHFSYPNSGPYEYFNEQIREFVIKAGYDSSSTSINGFVGLKSDRFALRRVRTVPNLEEIIHTLEWDRVFGK